MVKSQNQVNVLVYKDGGKIWRDFKAELVKRYENAVAVNIAKCAAFTAADKQHYNGVIVVPKRVVLEKRMVKGVDNDDMPVRALNPSVKMIAKQCRKERAEYAKIVSEASVDSQTIIEVAKKVGRSTTFVRRVAEEFSIKLPRHNNGHAEEMK